MNTRTISIFIAASACVFGLVACGGKKPPPPSAPTVETDAGAGDAAAETPPPPKKTLYERLGGKDAIKGVVDALVKRVAADKKVNGLFKNTKDAKMDKFKDNLVNQICEATGGDCKYTGKSMKDAHKGMKINEDQWQSFVQDLDGALDDLKVGQEEKSDLLAILAPMKDDIVDPKAKPAGKK